MMLKNLLSISAFMLCLFSMNAQTTILDFETPATSAAFQYFGSSLDGTLNTTIANPDASGINTSSTVAQFDKPPGSETWAGAFADVPTVIDFSSDNEICLKVWLNEPTNLLLKVEGGLDGAPDWELARQIDDTQTWVEVCYNVEGQAAEGRMYSRLTLFFDFNEILSTAQVYYFDDVITRVGVPDLYDVTFSVDMNDYQGAFDTVYVSGSFNGFNEASNPLEDSDGDGIWTGTILDMAPGNYEYLFQLDKFDALEDFGDKYYDCTNTTFGQNGEVFINRTLNVSAATSIPTTCFNSCYACGGAVTLTIHLGEGNAAPSADGFYIAGGGNFGLPGQFSLSDDDGNGIHSGRFEKVMGFTSFYTYTNGACGDFSCKEDISGQDCANSANYDDRAMGPFNSNTIIADCYESCSTDIGTGSDCLAALPVELLPFKGKNVNNEYNELSWQTATEINSDFFEIQKSADGMNFNTIGRVDAAGNSTQVLTYTFRDEAPFIGKNYYRLRMVDLDETYAYSNLILITVRPIDDIAVYPVPARDVLSLVHYADNIGSINIHIVDMIGKSLLMQKENTTQGFNAFQLNISQLPAGEYFIHFNINNKIFKIRPFVKE